MGEPVPFRRRDRAPEAHAVTAVFRDAVEAVEGAGIDVLVIGGLATSHYGRSREVRDIDLLVREGDAAAALEALARAGFETKVEYPEWLYKAFKSDVLVDVIFKPAGQIEADDEMFARATSISVMQTSVRMIGPEDLVVMLVTAARDGTDYWHNAEGVVKNTELDWDYLVRRAHPHPRRLLGLLLFCLSEDVDIPRSVLDALWRTSFGVETPT